MFGFNNSVGSEGERIIDAIYHRFKTNPANANFNVTKGYDGPFAIRLHLIWSQLLSQINSSMTIFGLPVEEVTWEGDYIDVTLA